MTDKRPIRIIRAEHSADHPYFPYRRATAQDFEISLAALGLLTYMLSKPDDWQPVIADMAKRATEYTIYKLMRELRKAGYVTLDKEYQDGRIVQWVYRFYEAKTTSRISTSRNTTSRKSTHLHKTEKKQKTEKSVHTLANEKRQALIDAWVEVMGFAGKGMGVDFYTTARMRTAGKLLLWPEPVTSQEITAYCKTRKAKTPQYEFLWLEQDLQKARLQAHKTPPPVSTPRPPAEPTAPRRGERIDPDVLLERLKIIGDELAGD